MKTNAQVAKSYLSWYKLLALCLAPKQAQHLATCRQLAIAPLLLGNLIPQESPIIFSEWFKFAGLGYQSLGLKPGE